MGEYEIIDKYSKLGFLMSAPVDFGTCGGGKNCYMQLTYIEGADLEESLPKLSEREQYLLGRDAGMILKKIHSLDLEECDIPAETKKAKKLYQLKRYEDTPYLRVDGDEIALKYVKDNIENIKFCIFIIIIFFIFII